MEKGEISYWIDTADAAITLAEHMQDTFTGEVEKMDDKKREYLKIAIAASLFQSYLDGRKDIIY